MGVKLKNRIAVVDIDDDIYDGWYGGISLREIKDGLEEIEGEFTGAKVLIDSAGGDVVQGMGIKNIFEKLVESGMEVDIEITGVAASISSVIALSGTSLKIRNGGYLMIHNPYTIAMGDHNDLRSTADTVELMFEDVVDHYEKNSTLSRAEIVDAMANETWYGSKSSVENGFADDNIALETGAVLNFAGSRGKRSMVMNSFKNVPKHILSITDKDNGSETAPSGPLDEGEGKMNLKAYFAKFPDGEKEHDAAISAARTTGAEGESDATAKVLARVKGIVASDTYKAPVRALAMEVLAGEKDVAALDAVVAVIDMQAEESSSKSAQTETEKTGETSTESQETITDEETTVENSGKITVSNFKSRMKESN